MADVVTAVPIRPISRLLIANRGEIARRIMRTAHELGIATVAVYADDDADAPFVREADMAVALDGRSPAETYLDIDKMIDACRTTAAEAVHPGYGFLSENENFAQAVLAAGMQWIGPKPAVIARMGDKLAAKRLMREAGVPTLDAVEIETNTNVAQAAADIGYPVLVKAVAGGGGRGMRVVEKAEALADAIAGARREAATSFGDDTVFLEKWLQGARHVEIQIIGDAHGNLVHCFERECSIQRRHQKIIEEAPSPAITEAMRERMGTAAIAAAKQLGYSSAGTVEFLVSGDAFWFLEVNARLQVEHPVTEAIISRDLVREQIRIAEGEPLSFRQTDLSINGHAIEARLYAEEPDNDFLPAPGTLVAWRPSSSVAARFDSGVESGSLISAEFDPMIAKVITWATTRREAAAKLARALETTTIQGLTTNRDFLVSVLRTPEYLAGDTSTDFIDRVNPPRRRMTTPTERLEAAVAVALASQARRRAQAKVGRSIATGWRNSIMPMERIDFRIGDQNLRIEYRARRDGKFRVFSEGSEMVVTAFTCGSGQVDMAIDRRRLKFELHQRDDNWFVQGALGGIELREIPRHPVASLDDRGGGLHAPMPGTVLAAEVEAGDAVAKGQLLLILEAMKMEHRITAPRSGTVGELHVAVGDQVENGQLLVTIG